MRFGEIHSRIVEQPDARQAVMDVLLSAGGENMDSVHLSQIVAELESLGVATSREALYDLIVPLDIVDRIEDDVVYFHTTSPESRGSQEQEKDDQTVSNMAKKKIDKEL